MQNNFIFIDFFLSQKCYKRVYLKSIVHAQTKQPKQVIYWCSLLPFNFFNGAKFTLPHQNQSHLPMYLCFPWNSSGTNKSVQGSPPDVQEHLRVSNLCYLHCSGTTWNTYSGTGFVVIHVTVHFQPQSALHCQWVKVQTLYLSEACQITDVW